MNCVGREEEPGWWSLQVKCGRWSRENANFRVVFGTTQGEVGHRKSPRQAPRSRVTDGGAVCCLVRQRKRSQLRCWKVEVTQEQEGRVLSVHKVLGDAGATFFFADITKLFLVIQNVFAIQKTLFWGYKNFFWGYTNFFLGYTTFFLDTQTFLGIHKTFFGIHKLFLGYTNLY